MAADERERVEAAAPAAEQAEAASAPSAPGVAPGPLTPSGVLALQRGAGNASMSRARAGEDVRARTGAVTGFDLSGANFVPGSPVADALGAEAVTVGHDVHLGAATPPAGTPHGDHVIAHELAHVVQQSTGRANLAVPGRADVLEREAEHTAERSRSATPAGALRPLPAVAMPVAQAFDPRHHRRVLVRGLQGTGFADVEGERPLEPRIQAFKRGRRPLPGAGDAAQHEVGRGLRRLPLLRAHGQPGGRADAGPEHCQGRGRAPSARGRARTCSRTRAGSLSTWRTGATT